MHNTCAFFTTLDYMFVQVHIPKYLSRTIKYLFPLLFKNVVFFCASNVLNVCFLHNNQTTFTHLDQN